MNKHAVMHKMAMLYISAKFSALKMVVVELMTIYGVMMDSARMFMKVYIVVRNSV